MKIIIAGSRTFYDYAILEMYCDTLIKQFGYEDIEIVSGTAQGADRLGEQYAEKRGYGIKRFPALWGRFGRSAGYFRNKEMAEYADVLIAFWDGKSKGTDHMIALAGAAGLKVHVVPFAYP